MGKTDSFNLIKKKNINQLKCSHFFWLPLDEIKKFSIPEADTTEQGLCSEQPEESQRSSNLFFVETTGEPCLTARQACSVESAARANPHLPITLYMEENLISTLNNKRNRSGLSGQQRNCRITDSLRRFTNVQEMQLHLCKLCISFLEEKVILKARMVVRKE